MQYLVLMTYFDWWWKFFLISLDYPINTFAINLNFQITPDWRTLHLFQQSLCSEMAEELRFAVRCHGSRQRPALKRSCTRCSPGTTYVPAALDMPHINGVSMSKDRRRKVTSVLIPVCYIAGNGDCAHGWIEKAVFELRPEHLVQATWFSDQLEFRQIRKHAKQT